MTLKEFNALSRKKQMRNEMVDRIEHNEDIYLKTTLKIKKVQ